METLCPPCACSYEVTAASSPACVPFSRYNMSALDAERSAFTALAIGGEWLCSLQLLLSTFHGNILRCAMPMASLPTHQVCFANGEIVICKAPYRS